MAQAYLSGYPGALAASGGCSGGSRRRVGIAKASLIALGLVGGGAPGCAPTVYMPTQPRPTFGPGVMVEILSMRGAGNQVELGIHNAQPSVQPSMIGPITWSEGNRPPCSGTTPLMVTRPQTIQPVANQPTPNPAAEGTLSLLDPQFPSERDDIVFVQLGTGSEVAVPGLFLDVPVATPAGQECLRLPLTAAGSETLWQASRVPWIGSFSLRLEDPLGDLGGNGAGVMLEGRAIRPVGSQAGWRPFFGFLLGGKGCRGVCPRTEISFDDDGETPGLLFHYGLELGLERRFAIGRRGLGLTAGASLLGTHLGAQDDFVGDRNGGLWGPFAAASFFGGSSGVVPGFSPPARRGSLGVELSLARQTAFARGPTQTAWVAAFAVRIEGSN